VDERGAAIQSRRYAGRLVCVRTEDVAVAEHDLAGGQRWQDGVLEVRPAVGREEQRELSRVGMHGRASDDVCSQPELRRRLAPTVRSAVPRLRRREHRDAPVDQVLRVDLELRGLAAAVEPLEHDELSWHLVPPLSTAA
jgi:hypothetical protein